jgi:CelD/BcsL family acetyltransferase involved in cellulose biosynthesis
MLEVSNHQGPLISLASEWSALVDERHPGAPFRTFAWISSWWNAFSTGREPMVLLARRGKDLAGVLPLYCERTTLGGQRLRLMGDGIVGSDYLGAIARGEELAEVSRAFASHLRALDPDELQLDDLTGEDPLIEALGDEVLREPRYRCPFVRPASSFADYISDLPEGAGQQFRRRRRWLVKFADYRIEELSTPREVEHGLETLFRLHRMRWELEGGSDAIDGPRTEAFHRSAGRALAELGWSRVYLLHAGGGPRAALYGWRHADRFAFYQAGHEPSWRPRSVGTVLLGEILERVFEENLDEFDFLRGDESYKLRWATGWRETVRARYIGSGLRARVSGEGRALASLLRERVKRALPAPALDWLRAARKAVAR